MARAPINKEINTFVRGLITEANLLAFPENASVVDENLVLNLDGSRQRRFGLGFENNGKGIKIPYTNSTIGPVAISVHEWYNVDEDPNIGLVVVQIGKYLLFFDAFAETVSASLKNSENVLELVDIDEEFAVETTSLDGSLIVVTGSKYINVLTYDVDSDVVSQSARNIKIRDRFGIDDGLQTDNRPATLSNEHKYNLLNQGWTSTRITDFFSSQGVYPSNADVVFLGRDDENNFDPAELVKVDFQGTPAPKGKFIIDPFDRGSSRDAAFTTGYGGSSVGSGTRTVGTSSGDFSITEAPEFQI